MRANPKGLTFSKEHSCPSESRRRFSSGRIALPILAAIALLLLGLLSCKTREHSVTLTWQPSRAAVGVAGYNVYRSANSGGPYSLIQSKVSGTTYIDKLVTTGRTYYYVVTAVDTSGKESGYSQEISATVP